MMRGKKVKGRKRHIVVKSIGMLLAVVVLPANVQDRVGVKAVLLERLDDAPNRELDRLL